MDARPNKAMPLAALLLGLVLGAGAHAQQDDPAEVVKKAADTLAERMEGRREELQNDPEQLYELIDDILLPRFDRRYSARLVLGRHARDASDEQVERFIQAFYDNLLQRYADGVLEYDQDNVEILPWRGSPDDKRTMVRTFVTLDDGTRVPVNYALVKRSDGWKMFDVNVEGISYVRNFRAELDTEIRQKGLNAVIERLEKETAEGAQADGDGETSGP